MFKKAAFFIATFFEPNIKFRQRFLNITIALIFSSSLLCCNIAQGLSCITAPSPASLNFGTFNPLDLTYDYVGAAVVITCVDGSSPPLSQFSGYPIYFYANFVSYATPTSVAQPMTSGGNLLGYNFYQNSGHTIGWGGSSNTGGQAGSVIMGAGAITTGTALILYAQIPPQATIIPGSYSYNVGATLNYGLTTGYGSNAPMVSFPISATVPSACNVSTSALGFGNYNFTANTLATATISVTCTNTTTYTVGLNGGTGGTDTARYMANGANHLTYALYSNTTRTTNWGNTAAHNWATGTGTGNAQTLTVYGTVPSGQSTVPASGTAYSDIVTVTVSF